MKSLTQINTLIQQKDQDYNGLPDDTTQPLLLFDAPKKQIKPRDRNKRIAELEFLLTVRNYLETNPTEAYIIGEITRIKTLIANISKMTVPSTFYPPNFSGDAAAYFNKKMGIVEMKEKIKTLEFILAH